MNEEYWPFIPTQEVEIPETKKVMNTLSTTMADPFPFNTYSTFTRTQRITAWCLRYIQNLRLKAEEKDRVTGNLTVTELSNSLLRLVKLAQEECFKDELNCLKNMKSTSKLKIIQLLPFLDNNGVIRVGGRLKNSKFALDKKHPILLSGKHSLTKLIFEHEHTRLLHAGPQQMLASIRQKFWPTSGRNLARSVFHKCVTCFKVRPLIQQQLLGNLSEKRLIGMYPFFTVGIDYAGPFQLKERGGRSRKTFKCYIALLVCFATKALHLEPVTDLTSEQFIATFRRFVSRRGRPNFVYSDNGTNFVGASKKFNELGTFLTQNSDKLINTFANENVEWHFIPTNSPHFGGLWEAGVKTTKFHLKRVLCNSLISLEEFFTVLTQIEGILNSRPIHPLSSSPDDYEPLTPSHFLLGRSTTALPDPDVTQIPWNRLAKYQHIQRLVQHFWQRWSKEYISEMQQRTKWTKPQPNLKIGDLVLVKEDNLPSLRWKLGRVTTLQPGNDQLVRVASVQTSNGVLKRNITKLCRLPLPEEDVSVQCSAVNSEA